MSMELPEASARNLGILFSVPIVGIGLGAIAPVNKVNQYSILAVRPAPWVFGVAWLILYFLVSFAWIYALSSETQPADWYIGEGYDATIYTIYSLLVLSLYIWPFLYNKSTRWALYSIVMSMVLVMAAMVVSPTGSRIALTPLIGWLFFATMLNYTVANSHH